MSLLAADVGWVSRLSRDEPGFDQHPLGRDVLFTGRRLERAQSVAGRGELAQLPHRCGRHPATGHPLCDPVADVGCAVLDAVQIEAPKDRAVLVDEHITRAKARLLLGQ